MVLGFLVVMAWACRVQLPVDRVEDQRIAVTASLPEDEEMTAIIAPYKVSLDAKMDRYLAYTPVALDKQGMNNTLGIFAAEALKAVINDRRAAAGMPEVDIVLINIGGLRRSFAAGELTVRSMYELMPFENEAVTVTLPGSVMTDVLRFLRKERRGTPVAGMQIFVQDSLRGGRVNEADIDPAREYTVLTNDYLLTGADGMEFFRKATHRHDENIKIRDLFIQYLESIDTVRVDRSPAYIMN